MAQLTDDCFAFSGPLMPLADMERLIVERVQAVSETEMVSLNEARGRVVADDIASPLDLPPFDNSAVDGYAVRHRDLAADGGVFLNHPARKRGERLGQQCIGHRSGLADRQFADLGVIPARHDAKRKGDQFGGIFRRQR